MTIKLSQEDKIQIKQLHRSCKQRKHADKLKAILLLLDDDTIRKYSNIYLNQGATSLLIDDNKGRKPLLTAEQLKTLEKHICENTYMDSNGIVCWIEKQFSICYSTSGINSLLKRLGFVYKKPVLTPCKANLEKQEEFVAQYKELKESLSQEDQIFFMDGVHPQHNTIAHCGWIKKKGNKTIKNQ